MVSSEKEIVIFSHEYEGVVRNICIGFTRVASESTVSLVTDALQSIPKETWLKAAMSLPKASARHFPLWMCILTCLFGVLLAMAVLYILRLLKKNREKEQNKMTDPLTNIGNKEYFQYCFDRISEVIHSLYYAAYICLDTQKLEKYFGCGESEEIQRYAANVITTSIADSDFSARIGDGVFAVAFLAPDSEAAVRYIDGMLSVLNRYEKNFSKDFHILFRAGIYPFGKKNVPLETILYNARQGYHYAVQNQEALCLCDSDMLGKDALRVRLQRQLSDAIKNNEFQLYLQFVVDAKTGQIAGAEVLSRWHNYEEGVLTPGHYIDDLKTAGMIVKLDFYIFEKTCELLERWHGTAYGHLCLSCNFIRQTLSHADFFNQFHAVIEKYRFDYSKLIIEIAEDSFADNQAVTYQNILACKKTGCRIALDDLGSGYTSFSDLCDYPIDIIKIDRSIVAKSTTGRASAAVLKGIIKLAHDLEIDVLCEGVETEAEREMVTLGGCDYIQGYLYSHVLPVAAAMDFYEAYQSKIGISY